MPTKAQHVPKILFVTSHWPLAPAYGAQQRVLNIGNLLGRFASVSFVIVPTEIEDEDTARKSRNEFEICRVIRPVVDEHKRGIADRLRHEFDGAYTATDPYTVNGADRDALHELMGNFDLVWIHTIRTANWFRWYRWPHAILDVDDLPSRTYRSAAQSGDSVTRRVLDQRMARVWRRRERAFLKRFDVLTVCSNEDREYLGSTDRIHVVPNGSNAVPLRPRVAVERPRLGFIGNCGFAPNEEGLKWFAKEVWPLVKRQMPNADLRLVGRESNGCLTKLGPDIAGLGWLEDPAEEIATWSAMIVPIRVGAGTRVKLADGFARKCPVVTTTMGAFGYGVENEREVLLADGAAQFADGCIRLLQDPGLGENIAGRAYSRFLKEWTWNSFEGAVRTAVGQCLALRESGTQRGPTALGQPAATSLQASRGAGNS